MNTKKTAEQLRVAAEIVEKGHEWEWLNGSDEWRTPSGSCTPLSCLAWNIEIRIKPWTLGRSINGFTLADETYHGSALFQKQQAESRAIYEHMKKAKGGDAPCQGPTKSPESLGSNAEQRSNPAVSAMTNDEIRIACAKALGWTKDYYDEDSGYRTFFWCNPDEPHEHYGTLPHYTTSADAALTLCDALRGEGYKISIRSGQTSWYCSVRNHLAIHAAVAATLSVAICKAFLAVKGQQR